jgi:hypothetical protein
MFFFSTGINETVPRFLNATGCNLESTLIIDNHLPTLSLEHLSLSLKSNLTLNSLLIGTYTLST